MISQFPGSTPVIQAKREQLTQTHSRGSTENILGTIIGQAVFNDILNFQIGIIDIEEIK